MRKINQFLAISIGTIIIILTIYLFTLFPQNGLESVKPVTSLKTNITESPKTFSDSLISIPLHFIENNGQIDNRVEFYENGPGHTIFLTKELIHLSLYTGKGELYKYSEVRLLPIDVRDDVEIAGEEIQKGKTNIYLGNDPTEWTTNIPTYRRVIYREAYPGINLEFYGNGRQLEYDIRVKEYADPSIVKFEYQGVDSLIINDNGDLSIGLDDGIMIQRKPIIYQDIAGARIPIEGGFRIEQGGPQFVYAFDIGQYDKRYPLIIDPILQYSTYIGGTQDEVGNSVVVDASGNVYITGPTSSTDFPATIGVHTGNREDVFVIKLDIVNSEIIYSTIFGGLSYTDYPYGDLAQDIALDHLGNVYITGITTSDDFPTTPGAFDNTMGGGSKGDAFVSKLNTEGELEYSTFLGGFNNETGAAIDVDDSGCAYVTGSTRSTSGTVNLFPWTHIIGTEANITQTTVCYITKLKPDGSDIVYSTLIGGNHYDNSYDIILDSNNCPIITGDTWSSDFPVTPGAFDTTKNDDVYEDVFVSKLDADGSSLIYSTFLGGNDDDRGTSIQLDTAGNVYVTGVTDSTDFPVSSDAYDTANSNSADVFVAKLDSSCSSLIYSTYLGGTGIDDGQGLAVDNYGCAYVVGSTYRFDTAPGGYNFPITDDAIDNHIGIYDEDAFIAKLNPGATDLVYSTYLGGGSSVHDRAYDICLGPNGYAYVVGLTASSEFLVTPDAFDTSYNGRLGPYGGDAFLTILDIPAGSHNTEPTVDAGGPYNVNEGASVVLNAIGDDPGDTLSYVWDLDDDGIFETPGQSAIFSAAALDGPSVHSVWVQVTDSGGLTAVDQATINVANMAPIVGAIIGPESPVEFGLSVELTVEFTDQGVLDTHTAIWNWGDGNQIVVENATSPVTGSYTYSTPGIYTVEVTVTDDDGGTDHSTFQYVVVYDPEPVSDDWAMFQFDPQLSGYNPNEITIGAGNAGTLELEWSRSLGGAGARSSPVVYHGRLFTAGGQSGVPGTLCALDAAAGNTLWTRDLGTNIEATPAAAYGMVYAPASGSEPNGLGKVYALDEATGVTIWEYETGYHYQKSSPVVHDGTIYMGIDTGKVVALDAVTGTEKWVYNIPVGYSLYLSSVALGDGMVYFNSDGRDLYALNVADGTLAWRFFSSYTGQAPGPWSSPTYAGGKVLVGLKDNKFYAFDAQTGAKVWDYDLGSDKHHPFVHSSPAVYNGLVYFGTRDGQVYAMNQLNGNIVWQYQCDAGILASPAVANGVLYISDTRNEQTQPDESVIYALDANTGTLLWSYLLGNAVSASPIISNGMLYSKGGYYGRYILAFVAEPPAQEAEFGLLYADHLDNAVVARNGLVASGQFTESDIGMMDVSQATPSLTDLSGYRSVLVWSNKGFADRDALGNVLADYVDSGGGVVIAAFAYSSGWDTGWDIGGRILDLGYSPFAVPDGYIGDIPGGVGQVDMATALTDHPIMAGVDDAQYFSHIHYSDPVLTAGSTLIAKDTYGHNLVAINASEKVVGIGIWPKHLDSKPTTDTRTLFANALKYVVKSDVMIVEALCPVNLVVRDPLERVISKDISEIPSATYVEDYLDGDSDLDDQVTIPNPLQGSYAIEVVLQENCDQSLDTFSLQVSHSGVNNGIPIAIVENELIQNIPSSGYGVNYSIGRINVQPIVTTITAPAAPSLVDTPITATATFTDPDSDPNDTHTAEWSWGDSTTSAGTVTESNGSGSVTDAHTYTAPGVYTVTLKVTDNEGGSGESVYQYVVIYDTEGGFVTGGGWINSPEGAYMPEPSLAGKANFGFVSKYKKGATVPIGNTEFNFKAGDLNFHSDEYEWLVINQSDTNAQYKGSGTINGDPAPNSELYKFMLWAGDMDPAVDTFRIRIWYEDTEEIVVYDNGFDQPIGGGNIKIHSGQSTAPAKPAKFALLQNYPNSFNPDTWIPYELAEDTSVAIRIYDITGKLVRTLDLGHKPAGFYTSKGKAAYWDGRNESGEQVSSGIYFYSIQAGEFTATRKMVVAK